jgi:monoamine oxidase
VAVVGAGLAGLHCAHRLAGAGVRVAIYEGSDRVGGRIATARDVQLGDQVAELGAEFISSGHRTMWALAEELEIALDDLESDAPTIHELWYAGGRRIDERTLAEQLVDVWPAVLEGEAMAHAAGAGGCVLDTVSVADWLDEHVPDACFPELHAVLASAYRSELGLEPDEQSALNLVLLLASADAEPFWTFGALDERFHCHAGNDAFVDALAAPLAGRIETDARLEAVRRLADGSLRLSFRRFAGSALEARADHVVLALPFATLRDVELPDDLDEEKRAVVDELGYGTNAKVIGSFRSRVWRHLHDASGSATTDLGAQQFWDASIGQGGHLGEITSLLGGVAGRDVDEVTAEQWMCGVVLPGLEQVFPGTQAAYLPGSALRSCWVHEPFAQGSYSCYRPGQWRFEGVAGRKDGRIHFCGEHCSVRFQSWMEGAAETGAVVAAEVLEDLGLGERVTPEHERILAPVLVEPHPCYHSGSRTWPRGRPRRSSGQGG